MKKTLSGIVLISAFLCISVVWACDSQTYSNESVFDNPLNAVSMDSATINTVAVSGSLNKASKNTMDQTAKQPTPIANTEMDRIYDRLDSLLQRIQGSGRVSEQIRTKLHGDNVTEIAKETGRPEPVGMISKLNSCLDDLDGAHASIADDLETISSTV